MGGCQHKTVDWDLAYLLIGFCVCSALASLVFSHCMPPLCRRMGWHEMGKMIENPDYRSQMRRFLLVKEEEHTCTSEERGKKEN